MSRYIYMTAAALLLFAVVAFGMTFTVSAYQPDLPASGSLWKTTSLFLLLGSLIAAFCATLMRMFEQVARRNEERRRSEGGAVIEFPGRAGAGQEKYSPRDAAPPSGSPSSANTRISPTSISPPRTSTPRTSPTRTLPTRTSPQDRRNR